ncbi:MAG: hypothetical protein V1925_01175 [Candidatus Omnitrophota bacterium]
MTEREFWGFLEKRLEGGRAQQVIGVISGINPQAQAYLEGHVLLPKDYDKLCAEEILKMGNLLLQKDTGRKAKETIMMILAHQPSEIALTLLARYNLCADRGLEIFAQMALEECTMWNE